MGVRDRVLLLLLLTPFLLTGFGVVMDNLESARHQSNTTKKVALRLGALAVAVLFLGFTAYLVLGTGDARWCTDATDPGCMHHGGE
jgi:hypothetical protein